MDERSQFTFYESFHKSIKRIKNKSVRADAYNAICEYALYGVMPDVQKLPEQAAIVLEIAIPFIETGRRKAEAGRRGGASLNTGSKNESASPNRESKNESASPNGESKDKDKDKDKDITLKELYISARAPAPARVASADAEKKTESKRFVPPSVDEVREYCLERGNGVDAEHFVDYYAAQGWKLSNGVAMKDWRAAIRTWEGREKERANDKRNAEPGAPTKWGTLEEYDRIMRPIPLD